MSGNLETYDVARIFSHECLQLETSEDDQFELLEQLVKKCSFPDFGAHLLQPAALTHICDELGTQIHQALSSLSHIPSVIVAGRMSSVWQRVYHDISYELYSEQVLKAAQNEDEISAHSDNSETVSQVPSSSSKSEVPRMKAVEEKRTGNTLLMELGIKTGLSVVFSLLKHAWSQIAWQKQLEEVLMRANSSVIFPAPEINLPNEILKSVLDVLMGIPPLSLSNQKTISQLSQGCLDQSIGFLQWVVSPSSLVDAEGKRLAMQIMISLYLQRGSLLHFLELAESVLLLQTSYQNQDTRGGTDTLPLLPPVLEVGFCQGVLDEIRTRTVSTVLACMCTIYKCTMYTHISPKSPCLRARTVSLAQCT